ncbi:hypothetical protein LWI28_008883 [Acer negundo]|uniref:RNase H type-1 domain-containing protein n=1 Tax=Acer negundo TaxID=4023 RepID=A0AAD5NFA7_ACENE|nr:hypothetical protein LWI28_008883 [Acer negundo]
MVSSTQCICAGYSPLVAEATAVLRGINLAIETGLVLFVIETDAVDVVNLIHVDEANMADVGLVIGEIISKLQTRSRGSGSRFVEESLVKWHGFPAEDAEESLVKWHGFLAEDATWESTVELRERFQNMDLEDKDLVKEWGIDKQPRRSHRLPKPNPKYMA